MSLQLSTEMVTALAERAKSPEMVKMRAQWKKSLTKTQKAKLDSYLKLSLPKLKLAATAIAESAPVDLKNGVIAAIAAFTDKDSLAYLTIDLVYGVVGSLPPEPLKVAKKEVLTGRAIKFGSHDGPALEGIVTQGNGVSTTMDVFVPSKLQTFSITKEQFIGLGEMKVETTMTTEQPAHKFTTAEHSKFAQSVPEPKAQKITGKK